nr:kin17-like protein [Quercus suber]
MNSTKWSSLTDFAKFLGKEGLCRVEEGERGLEISFIDDSPQAIRRREDVKRKERIAKGDEDQEERILKQQMKRAREEAEKAGRMIQKPIIPPAESNDAATEPIKVSLSFAGKVASKPLVPPNSADVAEAVPIETFSAADQSLPVAEKSSTEPVRANEDEEERREVDPAPKMSFSLNESSKPKMRNPLLARPKNPLKGDRSFALPEKKMSNTERIMREELERKRAANMHGQGGAKRQRLA